MLILGVTVVFGTSIQILQKKVDQIQTRVTGTEAGLLAQQTELLSLKQTVAIPAAIQQPDTKKAEGMLRITKSELSSYIPESCPPAGTYPETRVDRRYTLIKMGCGDSNWLYNATLVRRTDTEKDVVAFNISTSHLTWKTSGGSEHVLTAIGDKAWDSFEGFGGYQPVTVQDLTLDRKPLHILKKTFVYSDGGLGAFQGAKFAPNQDYTGGQLTVNGLNFIVDFSKATVVVSK